MNDIKVANLKPNLELKQKSLQGQEAETKLREVADLYEKHFIKEMMRQMKSTVQESGLIKKNNAEKIFEEQLDDQYSGEWNKRGGFGLSDMIYDQLVNRYGEQFGIKERLSKPQGPLELNKRSTLKSLDDESGKTFEIRPLNKTDQKENATSVTSPPNTVAIASPNTMPIKSIDMVAIKSPWAGTLQARNRLEDDKTSIRIKHDNGLESLIMIQGGADEETRHLSPGDVLAAGQKIAEADAASPLFWKVNKSVL